jgi:hypothetical protein
VAALTTTQVRGLTTANINALTTSQVASLSTSDIRALQTSQMAGLSTAGMVALTTCQVATLTTAQWAALTTAQIHALSTTQTQAYGTFSTPMVLDLNNDGIKTLGVSEGVSFDIFADGTKVNTGWVSSGDGLLVLDRNNDGSINDGSELFGSSTTLSGGVRATDGYAALRELDANQDGVISQSDKIFDICVCGWTATLMVPQNLAR